MRYTIAKWFAFEAAHSLPHLPDGHKCKRLHGHSYRVQLAISCDELRLDDAGFVTDYGDLHEFADLIDSLDHRNLDDFLRPSTAEHLAKWLYFEAHRLYGEHREASWDKPRLQIEYVEVRETEKTFARFGR